MEKLTTNNYNYNFYVINLPDEELKKYIEDTVKHADSLKIKKKSGLIKRIYKKDIYLEHLQRFERGEFGEISLRQSVIDAGFPYQCVLNVKANMARD